jgi:hypothetical protein
VEALKIREGCVTLVVEVVWLAVARLQGNGSTLSGGGSWDWLEEKSWDLTVEEEKERDAPDQRMARERLPTTRGMWRPVVTVRKGSGVGQVKQVDGGSGAYREDGEESDNTRLCENDTPNAVRDMAHT